MRRLIVGIAFYMVTSMAWAVTWQPLPCSDVDNTIIAMSTEEDWILIGEVTLSNIHGYSDTIIAQLYVREIANKLIYRVGYKGDFYSTRWHDESKTYRVTVNGKTYRCDVPVNSSSSEDDSKEHKFVGIWKWFSSGSWYVDITYNNGKYSFNLNPVEVQEIADFQEVSNGIRFVSVQKYDKRPELNRKGWKYYIDDRDNKAAPGYPTTGQYKYDRTVVYYTMSITLTGSAPVHRVEMMHKYYYLDGILTYEDIDTDFPSSAFTKIMIKIN